MQSEDMAILFDYMYWVNHRLLHAAGTLTSDQFLAQTTVTTRGLRATLAHELDVEWSWRLNLQGRSPEALSEIEPEGFPDVRTLSEAWRRDEDEMRSWLRSLTDQQLASEVDSGFSRERRPLWQFLVHVVTHAAQQQPDAATLLTLAGSSPGDLSFTDYLSSIAG